MITTQKLNPLELKTNSRLKLNNLKYICVVIFLKTCQKKSNKKKRHANEFFWLSKKMFVEPDEIKAYSLLERKREKVSNNNCICF